MRALFPTPADEVDLWEAYALPRRTPFVRCNMISSIDGAIAVHGRSGMLGGPGDRRVFTVLRGLADVVLVGAATVRAEGYGPARPDEAAQAGRVGRGQQPVPPIAVITRSGQLDWSSPFFVEAAVRPILLTSADADPRELERARPVADVIVAGDDRVDLRRGIAELNGRGYASVLVEGGPGINAQLVHEGLLDELCLTLAPRIVAGAGARILAGDELVTPLGLHLVHLLEEDGYLFSRLTLAPVKG